MDRNSSIVSAFVAFALAAVCLGGLQACENSKAQDTKRLTTCVEAGGTWVYSQCINPKAN